MKSWKRILKWGLIAVAIVAAMLLSTVSILNWSAGARLESRITALRAAGEPVRIADLARPPIPPEKNAATFLRRAQAGVTAIAKEIDFASPRGDALLEGRPSAADRREAEAAFAAYPGVIPLLKQAADCPDFDSQRDYTLNWHEFLDASMRGIQDHRVVARVLNARTGILLSRGQRDEALRTCIVLLQLANHFGKEPLMVGYLSSTGIRGAAIEMANRVLRSGELHKVSHAALDTMLAIQDEMADYPLVFKGERAFGLECFEQSGPFFPWPIHWRLVNDECDYLDTTTKMIEMIPEPSYKIAGRWSKIVSPSRHVGMLTRLEIPALSAFRDVRDLAQAQLRCLRVLNAMQAYTAAHDKSESKLADLKLPAEATIDPFTGKPLRVKGSPQGVTVYSVGKDLNDDGGSLGDQRDVGVGPAEKKMPDSN